MTLLVRNNKTTLAQTLIIVLLVAISQKAIFSIVSKPAGYVIHVIVQHDCGTVN